MAIAALAVEVLFGGLHLIPQQRNAQILEEVIRWKYTAILNIVFLPFALILTIRFLRTGGPAMLRMMSASGYRQHDHTESDHRHQYPK
jgi:uncharacterized protein